MDWADRTKGRGNAGNTANSFFHPSGPSEFGYVIQRKNLILQSKLARGAGRTPFHPVNPGSKDSIMVGHRIQRRRSQVELIESTHFHPMRGYIFAGPNMANN